MSHDRSRVRTRAYTSKTPADQQSTPVTNAPPTSTPAAGTPREVLQEVLGHPSCTLPSPIAMAAIDNADTDMDTMADPRDEGLPRTTGQEAPSPATAQDMLEFMVQGFHRISDAITTGQQQMEAVGRLNERLKQEMDQRDASTNLSRSTTTAGDPLVTAMIQPMVIKSANKVGPCDGSDTTKVLKWLRKLDAVPSPLDTALVAAEGAVAEYIQSRRDQGLRWTQLRRELAHKFISPAFEKMQRRALHSLQQRPDETVGQYAYEFGRTKEEAYPEGGEEEEMVEAFLSGLHDRRLAEEVGKADPRSLQDAIDLLEKEQKNKDRLRPKPAAKKGKVASLTEGDVRATIAAELEKGLASLQDKFMQGVTATTTQAKPPAQGGGGPRTAVECYRCRKKGHFARDCRVNLAPKPPQITPKAPKEKCERCRQTTHTVRNCRAGPPKKPCYCGGSHWLYDCPERKKRSAGQATQGN